MTFSFLKQDSLVWGMIGLFFVVLTVMVSVRHYNFQSQAWDMGIFVQTMWNTTEGRVMQNSLEELPHHLGVHASPFLFLLVPLYALFSSPYILLALQTLALALGAWPLYLLARRVLDSSKWARVVSAAYLLFPAVAWVGWFDFHAIAFVVPFLLAVLYLIEVEKWWWAAGFLALAASTKENAILVVLFVGLFAILKKGEEVWWKRSSVRFGVGVVVGAAVYFYLATQVLMPAFGGGLLRLDRYGHLGGSIGEIVINMFRDPGLFVSTIFQVPKLVYLMWLLVPVALLPILSWRSLVLLVPGLAQNMLSQWANMYSGQYQYDALLIAGVMVGVVYGLEVVLKKYGKYARYIFWIIAVSVGVGYLYRSPLSVAHFPSELLRENVVWDSYRDMVEMVPEGASVAAYTNLVPHLANRQEVYMLGAEPEMADVVLLDTENAFGFESVEAFQEYVDGYVTGGAYEVRQMHGRFVVLLRKDL